MVQLRKGNAALRRGALGITLAAVLAALAGCASSVSTPLPELGTSAKTGSLSQQQQKAAVDELNRQGATHEQDAERQIEQSR